MPQGRPWLVQDVPASTQPSGDKPLTRQLPPANLHFARATLGPHDATIRARLADSVLSLALGCLVGEGAHVAGSLASIGCMLGGRRGFWQARQALAAC
jgi:hypothetical protein